MSSTVFDYIYQNTGIYIDPAYLILGLLLFVLILIIITIIVLCKLKKLSRRFEKFMKGKDVESMEDILMASITKMEEIDQTNQVMRAEMNVLRTTQNITYQKLGIVRYDAFREMSGDLSYALALLNKEDNGFILNSVYTREGGYSYLKEIIKGECNTLLSEEEQKALEKAKSHT